MNPKVSVVIATHNHAHFLPECLASVRAQTYQDYEVIIVNNGSTDNTEEVIKKLAWDKLRYHYQNDTGSVAGPRNTGIKMAQGKYVAFLDSDDLWYKEKLEKVMQVFTNNPEVDIISHDLLLNNHEKKDKVLRVGPLKHNMFRSLLVSNCLLGSATIVKKSVLVKAGGFDESKQYVHCEDYETWIRIAYQGSKFHFLNETLGEYRLHKFNLSYDYETLSKNLFNVLKKHLGSFKGRNIIDYFYLYGKSMGGLYFDVAIKSISKKQYTRGISSLFKSFLLHPGYFFIFASMIAGKIVKGQITKSGRC